MSRSAGYHKMDGPFIWAEAGWRGAAGRAAAGRCGAGRGAREGSGLGLGAGEEDRPADLRAVLGFVGGVGEADHVVFADRAIDADGALGYGGAEGAVGAVDVVGGARVYDDRRLDRGDLAQRNPAGGKPGDGGGR